MSTAEPRVADAEALKADWLESLDVLVRLVEGWVGALGWRTSRATKSVTEPILGRYEVPLLLLERGDVEVVLSPLARPGPDGEGVVDLYLMPAYDDLASLRLDEDRWFIRPCSPPDPTAPRPIWGTGRLPLDEVSLLRVLGSVPGRA